LAWLSDFYNQRLGAELETGSPFLKELDMNFRDLVQATASEAGVFHMIGAEAVENHFIIHRKYLPDKTFVVPEDSGSRYFGSPNYLRNTDHFSTVKPDGVNHPGHQFLVTFYERFKKETRATNSVEVDRLQYTIRLEIAKKAERDRLYAA
jgi:hypothetical protein